MQLAMLVDGLKLMVDGMRRLRHARAWMLIVCLLTVALPAKAQTATDLNEGLQVTAGTTAEEFTVSWWGKTGRTYFIQQSFDLMTWQYVPVIESGAEAVCGLNIACTDTRQFWRLRYTDVYTEDAATADFDFDGLSNQQELTLGLDPLDPDTDADALLDGWEITHNLDPHSDVGVNGAQGDPDGDLLPNVGELQYGTNPHDADTDDDTLSDYAEVMTHLTSPLFADTDLDTLGDAAEINIHLTNPTLWDTDGDTLSDSVEVNTHGTNPLSKDSDNDGLDDAAEINTHQTNPNAADSDNDGITDKSEIKQGTNANNAGSRPAFESVEVVGDGAAGVRKSKQITITLPEGEKSYFVVIAAYSDEYPQYTGYQSEFDDVVDWKITPAGGTVIEGEKHVNALHEEWEQSVADGTSFLGLTPVAIVATEVIKGKASGTTSVQIELGAKNVSDALLPSTLAAMVIPADIMQPKLAAHPDVGALESVSTVRFCRWRDAFQDANGNETNGVLKNDFIASDPDRCVVRLPNAVVDPNKAYIGVKVTGIEGVGSQTEDSGVLALTQVGDYWESKPLIFVADTQDDLSYNGMGTQDGQTATTNPDNDQTRLAGFGAKIQIKFYPKGHNSIVTLDVATMMQPLQTVKVALNIVTRDGTASTPAQQQTVQEDFYNTKLIYRQIGYDLVQQGAVADHVLPAALRAFIVDTSPVANSTFYVLDGRTRTGANDTPASKNTIEYLTGLTANTNAYQLYWFTLNNYLGSMTGNSLGGEATGVPGNAALIVHGASNRAHGPAHELGHCMGLGHPNPNNEQLLMSYPGLPWSEQSHQNQKRFFHLNAGTLNPQH